MRIQHATRGLSLSLVLVGIVVVLPLRVAADDAREVYDTARTSMAVVVAYDPTGAVVGQGSGVAVTPEQVVTNWHVVSGADRVAIRLNGAESEAEIVRASEHPDLALLKVPGTRQKPIVLSDEEPITGDKVFALGAPRGLELTLTEGLVSGVRTYRGQPIIQTSADISPGSSGGALLDGEGRLVGITTFLIRGDGELNFAIPVDAVRSILERNDRQSPAAKQRFAGRLLVDGMYVVRSWAHGVRLVHPASIVRQGPIVAYTRRLRICVETKGCGLEIRTRVAVNCIDERYANLSGHFASYTKKDLEPTEAYSIPLSKAKWESVSASDASVDIDELRFMCAGDESTLRKQLAGRHAELLHTVRCEFLGVDELFELEAGDNGEMILRQKLMRVCRPPEE